MYVGNVVEGEGCVALGGKGRQTRRKSVGQETSGASGQVGEKSGTEQKKERIRGKGGRKRKRYELWLSSNG